MLTRSIVDGYFDPLVFWYQRKYLRTSKEFIFCRVSKIGNAKIKRNAITISSKVHEWLVLSFLFNHIWKDYEDRLVWLAGWWFGTNMFQSGWNHQPESMLMKSGSCTHPLDELPVCFFLISVPYLLHLRDMVPKNFTLITREFGRNQRNSAAFCSWGALAACVTRSSNAPIAAMSLKQVALLWLNGLDTIDRGRQALICTVCLQSDQISALQAHLRQHIMRDAPLVTKGPQRWTRILHSAYIGPKFHIFRELTFYRNLGSPRLARLNFHQVTASVVHIRDCL